ncbi:hypothetical protein CL618_01515 [archaeon]|nr:hypothetical protein [archaeon]|tara:strand:+ start:365 stop:592 length:228 start_codon:yes stop_codon:yes gene_type:complete
MVVILHFYMYFIRDLILEVCKPKESISVEEVIKKLGLDRNDVLIRVTLEEMAEQKVFDVENGCYVLRDRDKWYEW